MLPLCAMTKSRLCVTCIALIRPGVLGCARNRLLLSHQGVSIPDMARFYHVDRRSVSTWIDRWQTRGLVGLSDKPGSGRRPLLNDEEQQKVHDYLHQYPKDLKKVVQALEQETAKRVSTKTIKRLIKKTLCLETDQEITRQSA
jgi:transposase